MGGLGPGIGGLEYLIIGIVALVVVGPERLPGMLRQLGKWVAKMRGMANEFRSSFDEMARQSELDDLRKEVEALRTGQGAMGQGMVRLGDEANAAFKDIKSDLEKIDAPATVSPDVVLDQPEFPEPVPTPASPEPATAKPRKPRAVAAPKPVAAKSGSATATADKATAAPSSSAKTEAASGASAKPRAPRKSKAAS